jgi:replicative DNA helicase
MERLLRGLLQIANEPDAEDCLRNWWAFRDAGLSPANEPDQKLVGYFERWYGSQNAPPDFAIVREFFEKQDEIDVVDRLEEVKRALAYIRTNYKAILNGQRDQQELREFVLICREAANIAEHGRNLDKPVGDKRILKGTGDAISFLHQRLGRMSRKTDDVSAADALEAYVKFRAAPRMRTGVPALDASFGGGGLPSPRLVVRGGAPSAGKTSFATFMARNWMLEGHAVGFLAVDEGVEGVVGRICKMEGVDEPERPTALGSPEILLKLVPKPRREQLAAVARVANLPYFVNEEASVEQMTDRLLRFAENRKLDKVPVLVVDSLQTVKSRGSDGTPDPRQRVDSVLRACKQAVRRGVMVVALSELNRGAYRSKKVEEQVTDMAATKESGSIEFAAQTLLIIRTTTEEEVVTVGVPKNRGGKRTPFKLRLDFETMTYAQLDERDGPDPLLARRTEDADVLAAVVRSSPPITSVRLLREACRADGRLTNNERIEAARAFLETRKLLVKEAGVFRVLDPPKVEDMYA